MFSRVLVAGPNPAATAVAGDRFSSVTTTSNVQDAAIDIYAPCLLGGTVTQGLARRTTAQVICVAANNQLFDHGSEPS